MYFVKLINRQEVGHKLLPHRSSSCREPTNMMLRSLARISRSTWPAPQAATACSCSCVAASSTAPQVALVQGASRGLGLEYVRQLLQRSQQRSAWAGLHAATAHRGPFHSKLLLHHLSRCRYRLIVICPSLSFPTLELPCIIAVTQSC